MILHGGKFAQSRSSIVHTISRVNGLSSFPRFTHVTSLPPCLGSFISVVTLLALHLCKVPLECFCYFPLPLREMSHEWSVLVFLLPCEETQAKEGCIELPKITV